MKQILKLWVILLLFMAAPAGAGVDEIAPGVWFRSGEPGCNNLWVEFADYVFVIDANYPDQAEKIVEEVRKTTSKPIQFVFNTHNHGDHALGNTVWVKEGAAIVAQRECAKPQSTPDWRAMYGKWAEGKPHFEAMTPKAPTVVFDDHLVFDDGTRRLELLYFGHGHTKGDAVAYLPNEKILFTGDLCVNGAFNYLGDARTSHWIEILSILQQYDVDTVCPGHGPRGDKSLLETQKQYFIQLREQVRQGIDEGKSEDEILAAIDIPAYKEWTGVTPREGNIQHVYDEIAGLVTPWELLDLNLSAGPNPTRDDAGWTPPKKMLVRGLSDAEIRALERVAPGMEFVNPRNSEDSMKEIVDADAVLGWVNPAMLAAANNLRWVHSITAGVEGLLFDELVNSNVVVTNGQGMYGPAIADHVMGMLLMFMKNLAPQYELQLKGEWRHDRRFEQSDLRGKTMLILGLGGIGSQIAERAAGFGMTILAIDPQSMEKPLYIKRIAPPDALHELLPEADVVASTVPLTKYTDRYFGKSEFDLMKPSAYFINVGRGQTVRQEELVEALQNKTIAGAALDVFDPEPLPSDNPLWKMDNVIITPHMSGRTSESYERRWLLLRENVRRFAAGEPMYNVVDKKAGY
ncbi:MAG: MBL fold metallo-hydrolase [bacterium]|nr:MBL fold metallo-hydrolase [bacterium]